MPIHHHKLGAIPTDTERTFVDLANESLVRSLARSREHLESKRPSCLGISTPVEEIAFALWRW